MEAALLPAVIEEARRRQRRRRIVVGIAALLLAGSVAYVLAGHGSNHGATPSSKGTTERPVSPHIPPTDGTTLLVVASGSSGASGWFRSHVPIFFRPRRASDVIPPALLKGDDRRPSPLSGYSKLREELGRLLFRDSRAIRVGEDSIYLIPTSGRGACALSSKSLRCLPALNRQGISWTLEGAGKDGVVFIGPVASFVAGLDLVSDSARVRATLVGGLFSLELPGRLHPIEFLNLNPRFVVRYRDGRPPATVSLRSR